MCGGGASCGAGGRATDGAVVALGGLLARRRGGFAAVFGHGGFGLSPATASTAVTTLAGGAAAVEELEVFDDDAHLGAFRAVLGFPLIEFEAAFDEERVALLFVLGEDFGGFSEAGAIDEGGFLFFDAVLAGPGAIDGEAEVADSGLVRHVLEFEVARDVAHQQDLVQIGHGMLLNS